MQGHKEYQPRLFSVFNIEELIPKDHLLRKIDKLIDFSFVRESTAALYCQDNGRPSIDPEVFIRICLLTYLYNIPSDRQVCEEIRYNLSYRWFLRLSIEDQVPDHSSLTRIRDRLGEKIFKEIFEHIVRVCIERGLVKGDKVMMDGSLVKADAALNSMVPREDNLNIKDNAPSKYIIGKKFSNDTHVSQTDPDSSLSGKISEPKKLAYKVHDTIDRESRIVIDAHVTTGTELEGKVMFDRIDHIESTFNIKIEELTADRGYGYGENLDQLNKRNIRSFVPNFHEDVGETIDPEWFAYDKEKDIFTCKQGYSLTPQSPCPSRSPITKLYKVEGAKCSQCPLNAECFPKKLKHPRNRRVFRNVHWELQAQTKEREKTWFFQKTRGERQWKMEGIFAEAKDNHGLDRARYRGRAKMQIQAYVIAAVQNLKRLALEKPAMVVSLEQYTQGVGKVAESIFHFCFSVRITQIFRVLDPAF